MKKIPTLIAAVFLMACLAACGGKTQDAAGVALPGDDKVLATVNNSAVSAYDLDQAVRASLGQAALGLLDEKGKRSVLESLVTARAIAQVQQKALTATDRAVLDKQVAAYREQLLVKLYLARNTTGEPVSRQMVADYYSKHPKQFGAKIVKQYEVIASRAVLSNAERDKLLAALKNPDKQKNWAAWSETLKGNGLPVTYKSGNADPAILPADLRGQLDALKAGDPASLSFADGQVNLVRVMAETKIAPRPLDEVSAQIRKILLPAQLKKAVKQASDQVLAKANVEYKD